MDGRSVWCRKIERGRIVTESNPIERPNDKHADGLHPGLLLCESLPRIKGRGIDLKATGPELRVDSERCHVKATT